MILWLQKCIFHLENEKFEVFYSVYKTLSNETPFLSEI